MGALDINAGIYGFLYGLFIWGNENRGGDQFIR
jgi:hypothetical protein